MEDKYFSITQNAEGIFKEKGSKFIGIAFSFDDEQKLKGILDLLKKEHPSARHFCYAYRIGSKGEIFRSNDDGEPAGSAGKPILNTLLSNQITNVLVVVVRYFGGSLLGVPGLINAYKEASLACLHLAGKKECISEDVYQVKFDYEKLNAFMKILKTSKISILHQQIDQACQFEIKIRQSQTKEIMEVIQQQITHETQYIKTL
ncbi:MAG: hypothetical protein RI934_97 [Bacteroidota bacterium]|jgi:uncharacterized YigZ family protein